MQEWQGQLLHGERLRWSGRPAGGLLLSGSDALLIPFSLFFLGFSLFWITLAAQAPGPFWMFGLIFVAAGAYLVVGRFGVDAYLRAHTRYAVTDQRILIARDGIGAKFTAIDLSRLPPLTLRPRAGGRGTIRFGEVTSVWGRSWNNLGATMPSTDPTPQFLAIDNAQQVFDLIQRQQQKLAA